jgi:hypothetical protein
MFNPDITAQESRLQPDKVFPAEAGIEPAKAGTPEDRNIRVIFSTFFSRIRRSWRYVAAETGIEPAKAGTSEHRNIRVIFSKFITHSTCTLYPHHHALYHEHN